VRLLYVVQRYGREVAGGAELHCREFATRLAARGHDVEVLTSCALSYSDWANWYTPGTENVDGVTVHRLEVAAPRSDRFFAPLNSRVVWGHRFVPLHFQHEWMRSQGPYLPDLVAWLGRSASAYDVVVFFTYLYYPTWAGLPVAAGLVRTVLHPTAHDEPPLYLPIFDTTFRHPSCFAFSTEEEKRLVSRRFGVRRPSAVIGIGVDLDARGEADQERFRQAHEVGERPYLVYVGRLDPAKGSEELFQFFTAYKARNPGPLALVMVGDPVRPVPAHPDVVTTGVVDEATKRAALAGALALVQPSYFESFSMVLTEAWAQSKPALVQGHCEVLAGQARRSGGGIAYRGFAEFEATVDLLIENPSLTVALGKAGRRYVEDHYEWDDVLGRYLQLVAPSMTAARW
jgi:glycosyltransferase involved in cell wall biosynthesis